MKHRVTFSVALTVGILLLCAGLAGLWSGPDLVQYAFLPRSGTESAIQEQMENVRTNLKDSFPLLTLHGEKTGVSLRSGNKVQENVCVYLAGANWHEVYPRQFTAGRPVSRTEAEAGAPVIVLDEDTAFLFFGDGDPIGKTVKMGDTELEIIGIAKHSRRIGETGTYAAWIPLGKTPDCDLMVLSAPAPKASGLWTAFRTGAEAVFGPGTLIALPKEKTGATMMLRWVLLILAIWGMKEWLRRLGTIWRGQWGKVREESRRRYAGSLLPYALLKLLPAAVLTLLTVAAGYGLAVLAVSPARIFPEWIPESLGDVSAWTARFWDLTSAAGKSVSLQTPEMAELRFWAGLIRWGIVLSLLGSLRLLFRGRKKGKAE